VPHEVVDSLQGLLKCPSLSFRLSLDALERLDSRGIRFGCPDQIGIAEGSKSFSEVGAQDSRGLLKKR
jgi:hypothetical protein